MFKNLNSIVNKYFHNEGKPDFTENILNYAKKHNRQLCSLGLLHFKENEDYPQTELCIEYDTKEDMERLGLDDYGYCLLIFDNDDVVLDNIYFKENEDITNEQKDLISKTLDEIIKENEEEIER